MRGAALWLGAALGSNCRRHGVNRVSLFMQRRCRLSSSSYRAPLKGRRQENLLPTAAGNQRLQGGFRSQDSLIALFLSQCFFPLFSHTVAAKG